MAPLGGTDAAFFEHALELVMRRRGKAAADFRASNADAAHVLAEVACLTADHMAYASDTVFLPDERASAKERFLNALIESFDYARVRHGGDCEDLALEILLCVSELLRAHRAAGASGLVRELGLLASQYVFCMALGGVSSAEINGDFGKLKSMGAHMWTCAIPLPLFRKWWQRGNGQGRETRLLPRVPGEQDGALPLVLEGTGFLREELDREACQAEEDARELLRACAEREGVAQALGGLRKWFRYVRGRRNGFYQTVSILLTNHFLLSGASRHVCFAMCHADPSLSPPLAFGAEFAEFTRDAPGLALWAEPELDEEEMDCVRDCLKDVHPMPPHTVPPRSREGDDDEDRRASALLDRLAKSFPLPPSSPSPLLSVDYFVNHRVVLVPDKVEALRRALQAASATGLLLGLRWHREHVRPGLLGYRLECLFRDDRPSLASRAALSRRQAASSFSSADSAEEEEGGGNYDDDD